MKKSIVRYLIIFSVASVIAFMATVVLVTINNFKLDRIGRHHLAFVDLESGEVIPIPEFENKETGLPEPVCLRNSSGQIIFWGEFDYSTNTMTGDLFVSKDNPEGTEKEYSLPAILNQSSGKEYYLTTNTHIIQIGNYYILLNSNNIQTSEGEECRYYLSMHYCDNH